MKEVMMTIGRRKTGTRLAELSWDYSIGKFVSKVRAKDDNGNWENVNTNIENDKFRAAFDLKNVQVGWIAYVKGEGINAVLQPIGEDYGNRPSDEHKEGLRLIVKLDKANGGALHKFISTAPGVWDEVDKLHIEYVKGAEKHPNAVPLIGVDEAREVPGRLANSTVFVPVLEFLGWTPRPDDLPESGIPFAYRNKKYDKNGNAVTPSAASTPLFDRKKPKDDMDDEIPF
jgi:hypothetical protein